MRRDFLYLATAAVGSVGALAGMDSLIASMSPDAKTLAAGAPVDLDLSKVEPGQQVVALWRGKPGLRGQAHARDAKHFAGSAIDADARRSAVRKASAAALRAELASLRQA